MAKSARVISIDRLKDFRAALADFAAEASTACHEVDFEIERTLEWLKHDQAIYWKGEARKWAEEVARTKSELARKQIKTRPDEATPSAIDEKKQLERAKQRRDEAERKLVLIKQAERYLAKQAAECRVPMRQLGGLVEMELPVALEKLARMIDSLEQYVRLQVPITEAAEAESQGEEATSRPPLFPSAALPDEPKPEVRKAESEGSEREEDESAADDEDEPQAEARQ